MAQSFLQRLFGQKNRGRDAPSLGLTPPSAASQTELKSQERQPGMRDVPVASRLNSLFAFVDPKDPFSPGEIAGEELPGPILSIMSAKQFRFLLLFHTPHTRDNALATKTEVSRRYPTCRVFVHELSISDPKDYSSLMGRLARLVRILMLKVGLSQTTDCYVCVSSGTAEMRAAWFLLTALGVLPAKLLQVGSPAQPLFGEANVKEVQMDASNWQTIRHLAMPYEYFRGPRKTVTKPGQERSVAAGKWGIPSWIQRRAKKLEEKAKADEQTLWFDKAFVERARALYGDTLPEFLLPHLDEKLRRSKALTSVFSPDELQDFAQEVIRKFAVALRWEGGADHPERFKTLANSVWNEVLVGFYRSYAKTQPMEDSQEQASEMSDLRQKALEIFLAAKEGAGEATEEEHFYRGELPEREGLRVSEPSVRLARETLAVPGLDDALSELGIYVGSAILRHAAEQAGIAAETHLPVLLLGETGTGKERFAHLIHRLSPRFNREFVPVNCAAIPASLAESYLLGHVKGSFSGATKDGKGIFEAADHSTLFLDEIAELNLDVQAKLLRVIQDGVVQRLGSAASRKVDVRIIAASNRDLRKEVSAGRFREDLYFRLEVVQIKLPALRDRRSEIPELALMLLRQINQRRHKPRQLTTGALQRLERQPWPGNVRDLLNVLERSVLYSRTSVIDAEDLIINADLPAKDLFAALPEPYKGFKVDEYQAQVRNQLFLRALTACKGNQTAAAELLGVSKQAVSKFVLGQNDNEN